MKVIDTVRFSIRDVIWLTLVVGLILGWWLFWRSLPAADSRVSGAISVGGSPLAAGRVYFQSASGQILGATIASGKYGIDRIPIGNYSVAVEGNGVATKYGWGGPLTVTIAAGRNEIDFELRP
jgi:hypothetical protein